MHDETCPVLIVGGGPTGLAASVFLACHGVPTLLVEQRTLPSRHPRARALNPRTMEVFRSAGIEDDIRASPSPIAGNDSLIHVESVAGKERLRMPTASSEDIGMVSPCEWMMIDQSQLEPILRKRAELCGAGIRLGTRLKSLEQDPEGVTATVWDRATAAERKIRAEYLIAADGAESTVRRLLGIHHRGPGTITHVISVFFNADLTEALRGRRPAVCYVNNPAVRGTIIPIDNKRQWVMNVSYAPERGEKPEDFTRQRRLQMVRAAVGRPDLPVELDDMSPPAWELVAGIAAQFRDGRILLAGDAAHSMLPTGAFGASTGIQDAHNLGWKIALVRSGAAGQGLLATYESERFPVADIALRQSMLRFSIRQGQGHGQIPPEMVPELTMVFGYRYTDGALSGADGDDGLLVDPRKPTGRSGTRAPHISLTRDGRQISALDLFGRQFVMLTGDNGSAWVSAARKAGERFGLPIDVQRIGPAGDVLDPERRWPETYGVSPDGMVLVRPDGFIACRSPTADGNPAEALSQALSEILRIGASMNPRS